MNWEMIQGVVRHLLTALGGLLVAKGTIDAGMLEAAVGAVLTLGGTAWSIWHKKAK